MGRRRRRRTAPPQNTPESSSATNRLAAHSRLAGAALATLTLRLNMLCSNALQVHPITSEGKQRAVLLNYDSLPGAVPKILLPLFNVELDKPWLEKMKLESKHYSKSRGSKFKLFFGDSKDKDERATSGIQKFSDLILAPSFAILNKFYHLFLSNY